MKSDAQPNMTDRQLDQHLVEKMRQDAIERANRERVKQVEAGGCAPPVVVPDKK